MYSLKLNITILLMNLRKPSHAVLVISFSHEILDEASSSCVIFAQVMYCCN